MAGIPASAINVYSAASGGTIVTSGNSGTVVYGRIGNNFVETLTGAGLTITFPYFGRTTLSGTKTFSCADDSKILTINLPGFTGTTLYAQNYHTEEWVSGSGWMDLYQNTFTVTAYASSGGAYLLSFLANAKYVKIDNSRWSPTSSPDGIELNNLSVTANGQAIGTTSVAITNDTGRVQPYWVDVIVDIPSHSTGNAQSWGFIEILLSNDDTTWSSAAACIVDIYSHYY